MKITILLFLFFVFGCSSKPPKLDPDSKRNPAQGNDFKHIEIVNLKPLDINMRAGYSLESGELQGCILYLQGLADSIMNHDDLFLSLNRAGYRVIFFDYMGQGGSSGSMNNSRVQMELPIDKYQTMKLSDDNRGKYYSIPEQGQYFWDYFKLVKNSFGQDCERSKKIVMGWSTGGLAAYRLAHEKWADAVVLIAPGIHPKFFVGESEKDKYKVWPSFDVITERTLTRNSFANKKNPHVDPPKPNNPFAVPQFALNLKLISLDASRWKIDPQIKGLVFLGSADSYVNFAPTEDTINENAPHFKLKTYDGARHELHNETDEVTEDLLARTLEFLKSVLAESKN